MIEKIKAGLTVMRVGQEVANPAAWKLGQVTGNAVGALILALVALLKAFGYELPIDENTALLIGGGIVAVFNVMFTVATTKKVGLPPEGSPDPEPPHINHF